jgi:F0F1-type ATP synthase assembly protein I
MAADRPNQNENGAKRAAGKATGVVDSIVRAERMMQIAFILPAAVLVGWLAGAGLDKWLHQHWIYLAGIILGCVAGFIEIFRLVLGPEKAGKQANSGKG